MPRTRFSATDLQQLRRQVTSWRGTPRSSRRLPEEIWQAAAHLAGTHGVSRVAQHLRLDYAKLKQRCSRPPEPGTRDPGGACPQGFVEIPWLGSPAAARVELRDEHGRTMTLQLPGDPAVLVALAEAFWRRP